MGWPTADSTTPHTRAAGGSCPPAAYPPISDYSLIGNCRSAALIGRDGAIDWLCWPRFDSNAIFAAILDQGRGGTFRIRPAGDAEIQRRYLPGTAIVETTYRTSGGACVVRDLMPVVDERDKRTMLVPEHEILREIEGLAGEVVIEVEYAPRPGFGLDSLRLVDRHGFGIWCEAGGALYLQSDIPLTISRDGQTASGSAPVQAGQRRYLSLGFSSDGPAVIPPLGDAARERIERAGAWWSAWAGRCQYDGPYREAVVRSAITLKLLTFAPSGAIIAAPTTSLPEQPGGDKNWDYRFCWLRDASFTVRALYDLGYTEEAEAFVSWTLHSTRLSWPNLRVLYDVYGRQPRGERELQHLEGFAQSQPVRVGNGAQGQLQLDVYGEVIDAAWQLVARGGKIDRQTATLLRGLGETVCRRWREPDSGIWEPRGPLQHHTHSKLLCWVALDRLLALQHTQGFELPVARFVAERSAIRAAIEQQAFNPRLDAYAGALGGDQLDASVLTIPLYGFVDASSLRMRSTWAAVDRQLGNGAFVYRYRTPGEVPDEGTFAICAFWAIQCQAKSGDQAGATARFDRLLACANDVGLLAEEIDPRDGAALGNFPQGFSHIGLINAALALSAPPAQRDVPTHMPNIMEAGLT
ncbi:MAG TPA: glycoside hydrolase family 15 protein [Thermomicrobiales bacterium]|nr:glycoside hydrolase family 15 protein [Thermomicrobiales bacterium]